MSTVHALRPQRFRAVWISDVHLGFKGCRADYLLDFLKSTESEYLYLVGDIVDLWNMKKGLYWPQTHNDVIRTILGKAKRGTKVVYVPGNHDELLRTYHGMEFGNVRIQREAVHETADGRRLLILHGDQFDAVVKCSRLMAALGCQAYDVLLFANRMVNHVRRHFGFPYWSLATYLKTRMKNALKYIQRFEEAVVTEARRQDVDGVICGHIHRAEMTEIDGMLYCNDGDWVESCTALIERHDGELHLMHWSEEMQLIKCDSELDGALPERAA